MKTMFANLNAIVGDTLADSIQMIDIDELHESKDNFFAIDRIEEFAETILGQGGVKDNLVVRPLESGGYEIISGHRRKAAVQYLLDNGENISRYLPCLVQDYSDDDTRMLDLILMNISSRQISDTELWKSYEILTKVLQNKKNSGEKFGRTREKLAECLGVSPAQVGKMQNVERKAIPAIKEAMENGEISLSTANEISKLNPKEQETLVQKDLSSVKPKELKQMKQPEKVDTNINFSETESDSDSSSDIAESKSDISVDTAKSEKVDTNINFPETESESDSSADVAETKSNISVDTAKSEKVDTNINFLEDESKSDTLTDAAESDAEPENDFQNDEPDESSEKSVTDTLSHFIHEHYFELETIFTAYTSITDSDDEIQIIEEFQELLHKVKEAEREKIRFGV